MISRRNTARSLVQTISGNLEPLRAKRVGALPVGSPAAGINFPLIYHVVKTLDFPDKELAIDQFHGMSIAEDIFPVATLTERPKNATASSEQWITGLPTRNVMNLERTKQAQGSAAVNAFYEQTMAEVALCWVSEPAPLSTADLSRPLTPRLALEQEESAAQKIRLIDDFKASGANDAVSAMDTHIPDGADAFLAVCDAYKRILHGRERRAGAVDFPHAYKHAPRLNPNGEFAPILFPPSESAHLVATLRTQPFGSPMPPADWAGVTSLVKFAIGKLPTFPFFLRSQTTVAPQNPLRRFPRCSR